MGKKIKITYKVIDRDISSTTSEFDNIVAKVIVPKEIGFEEDVDYALLTKDGELIRSLSGFEYTDNCMFEENKTIEKD